jgi:hypothetical protein
MDESAPPWTGSIGRFYGTAALRHLRRYASRVVVQNAAQVNVGAQQLNIAGD